MKRRTEAAVICPECGERITEEDRKQENVNEIDAKEYHKKCKLVRK